MQSRKNFEPGCWSCEHFMDDPLELERQWVGISILSSTFGSTRAHAGICRVTGLFQDSTPPCTHFVARQVKGDGGGSGPSFRVLHDFSRWVVSRLKHVATAMRGSFAPVREN